MKLHYFKFLFKLIVSIWVKRMLINIADCVAMGDSPNTIIFKTLLSLFNAGSSLNVTCFSLSLNPVLTHLDTKDRDSVDLRL